MPKRLEQLSELVPQARTIAVLVNPKGAFAKRIIADMEGAAHTKGVQLDFLSAGSESDVERRQDEHFAPADAVAHPAPEEGTGHCPKTGGDQNDRRLAVGCLLYTSPSPRDS